jgi:hypothetical protein
MKYQKIRGHKRRQKDIEQWRVENLELRLDLTCLAIELSSKRMFNMVKRLAL